MPFIPQENRKKIDGDGFRACKTVGDLCYFHYKGMVERWNEEPRWTTAHNIFKDLKEITKHVANSTNNYIIAHELAWQVFFQEYVMPYEQEKKTQNGAI